MVVVAVVGTPAWQDYFLSLTEKFGGTASKNPAPISTCLAQTSYRRTKLPLYSMVYSTAV